LDQVRPLATIARFLLQVEKIQPYNTVKNLKITITASLSSGAVFV
jgi:hypothetical protein